MSKNNIFPKEIMDNTVEIHRFKHTVKSKLIYTIILLSIICIGVGLPFIYVDIYSSSLGLIKPEKERIKLLSLYSGKVKNIYIKQNKRVIKGDTLLIVDNKIGKEQVNLIHSKLQDNIIFIEDLNYLIKSKKINKEKIQSYQYQKEYIEYLEKINDLKTRYYKTKRDFKRQQTLYKKGVIAKVEFENDTYNKKLAYNNWSQFIKQQKSQWQAEITNLENQNKDLQSNLKQLTEENNNYIITSPTTGTIQNLIGLEIGSILNAGNVIAEISPETDLIAECYISPTDIGLLKKGNQVKFQIDAFDYNQWGFATGKIIDIGNDVNIINNTPMFRVICKIDQKYLMLKNGFKGKLKKGMTFNAKFFINRRSLYELLYDKVDNWFNPNNQTN